MSTTNTNKQFEDGGKGKQMRTHNTHTHTHNTYKYNIINKCKENKAETKKNKPET